MFDLANFTPWVFFTDMGIICGLLLIGKFLRVKIRIIQKLFIPPSLLAGILGLAFGPGGLGWLPLSGNISTYAAILIAVVFGIVALVQKIAGTALGGFTTVILLLLFSSSLVMISLGIIGYYIARIYEEIKGRPRYIISRICGREDTK